VGFGTGETEVINRFYRVDTAPQCVMVAALTMEVYRE
jgi:hypothetical protein